MSLARTAKTMLGVQLVSFYSAICVKIQWCWYPKAKTCLGCSYNLLLLFVRFFGSDLGPGPWQNDSARFAVSVCVFESSRDALDVEIDPFLWNPKKVITFFEPYANSQEVLRLSANMFSCVMLSIRLRYVRVSVSGMCRFMPVSCTHFSLVTFADFRFLLCAFFPGLTRRSEARRSLRSRGKAFFW